MSEKRASKKEFCVKNSLYNFKTQHTVLHNGMTTGGPQANSGAREHLGNRVITS